MGECRVLQDHPVVPWRSLTRVYFLWYLSWFAFFKCNVFFAMKKNTEQKLPSFSNRVKMIGGRVWECMNECSLSFRHLPLSLCSTRGVPTGDVWWASYSIRGALLGRPHQCWVDDVVITLVCIPLLHHSVVDCFMEERMDEIEGESVKEEGEGERHGWSEMEVYQKCLTGFKWTS